MTRRNVRNSRRLLRGPTSLWDRELGTTPRAGARFTCLGIVVLATIVLYYQFYLVGAVATHILAEFHMSFTYYVNIGVVGYIVGAVGLVRAGVADRYGRGEHRHRRAADRRAAVPVRLPARRTPRSASRSSTRDRLRRGHHPRRHPGADPRLQPAARAGLGDGLLDARPGARQPRRHAIVVEHLDSRPDLAGPVHDLPAIVGLVVFVVALVVLRELAPRLRDQLMVSTPRPRADRGPRQGHRRRGVADAAVPPDAPASTSSARPSRSACS